jgi:hypothetical protein
VKTQESVVAKEMIVTREMARNFLQNNSGNRAINNGSVDFLAKEMLNGRWVNNYSPIRIGKDGRLLDGQHRCMAVVKTGIPIESLVVFGVPEKCFITIDAGQKPRSACNALQVCGKKNTGVLAGAAKFVWGYQNNLDNPARISEKISNGLIMDMVRDCGSELEEAANFCSNSKIVRMSPPSLSAGLLYLFSKIDREAAYEFWGMISSGVGAESFDTIYQLRERLISNIYNKTKMSFRCVAAIIIKTWNSWRSGVPLKRLAFVETGPRTEPFPRIEGGSN